MKSVMTHQFSRVPTAEIQRSTFDRSHGHKTTFDAGYLVPVFWDLVLPGDTLNLQMAAFARLATPLKAPMDRMKLSSFFLFCPWRLIWTNFPKFMGEQANPADSISYVIPQMVAPAFGAGGVAVGSLSDYFGIPTGALNAANTGLPFNSFLHRIYNLAWNQIFRDQNLQNSVTVDLGDGPDTYTNYVLLRRGKRHDYFTSALPWPLKGGVEVPLPLGSSAQVKTSSTTFLSGSAAGVRFTQGDGSGFPSANRAPGFDGAVGEIKYTATVTAGAGAPLYPTNLYADLSTATAATINSLRQAFQLQRFYERDARGGTRYTELIKSHFQVESPDARLQRVEILGLGSSDINIHPVANSNATPAAPAANQYQGNISSFGTAAFGGHGFTKSFTEHGFIMGLVCVDADLTYQQGLNHFFSIRTRADVYWPVFSHLGEQVITNRELWAQGGGVAADALTFGYQERHAPYRYKPSQITGLFRSDAAGTLDFWHLSQDFSALPALNATFIQSDPPIDRVIGVPTEPHFLCDMYFKYICARPMPVYGVPGLIDHL